MKKCPFCSEEIQDDAIKCRFCGEYLKKKDKWKGCLIGCLLLSILLIIFLVLLMLLVLIILKSISCKLPFGTFNLPPHHYPPFGGGLEDFMREFSDAFRGFWERFFDFFNSAPDIHKI